MRVIHILKDGSRPKDITGHVVKVSEATTFYEIMKNLNRRLSNEKNRSVMPRNTPAAR